ncbi:MAG: glycosyltransferase family 2 protein [Planctomycetes bacterium]|nr:glycosyltransferase family 2 protein [Planctomycetota bacterium]
MAGLSDVSVSVITYNEERNIRDCLDSVTWAGEIVVVDSLSDDRTLDIAKGYTDKVFQRKWTGINDQRNFALEKCTRDWVLCIDADERVTSALRDEIERALKADGRRCCGYMIPRLNYYFGRWMKHGGWYPNYRLRFFRRDRGRFGGKDPHDLVILDGPTKNLRADLLHYSFESFEDQIERTNRYSEERARLMFRQGVRFVVLRMLISPIANFIKVYMLQRGVLDGRQGFIAAVMSSFHAFLKYAKLWALMHSPNEVRPE